MLHLIRAEFEYNRSLFAPSWLACFLCLLIIWSWVSLRNQVPISMLIMLVTVFFVVYAGEEKRIHHRRDRLHVLLPLALSKIGALRVAYPIMQWLIIIPVFLASRVVHGLLAGSLLGGSRVGLDLASGGSSAVNDAGSLAEVGLDLAGSFANVAGGLDAVGPGGLFAVSGGANVVGGFSAASTGGFGMAGPGGLWIAGSGAETGASLCNTGMDALGPGGSTSAFGGAADGSFWLGSPTILQFLSLTGWILIVNAAYSMSIDLKVTAHNKAKWMLLKFVQILMPFAAIAPFYVAMNFMGAFGEESSVRHWLLRISDSPGGAAAFLLAGAALSLLGVMSFVRRKSYCKS